MIKIYSALFMLLVLLSCEKFELPRDNLLDGKRTVKFESFDVVYDGNSDGIISKGETAYLKVYIKNNEDSIARDVKASISSNNSYVSGLYPTTYVEYDDGYSGYNDLWPNHLKYGKAGDILGHSYTLKFSIDVNTPSETIIKFDMLITDSSGSIWNDSFEVTVYGTRSTILMSLINQHKKTNF